MVALFIKSAEIVVLDGTLLPFNKMCIRDSHYINVVLLTATIVSVLAGMYVIGFCKNLVEMFPMFQNAAWNTAGLRLFFTVAVSALMIYILLVFGIVLPKKIAGHQPEKWVNMFYPAVKGIFFFLFPFIFFIEKTAGLFGKIFGIDPNEEYDNVTEEEIMSVVNEGHEQGVLLASEAEMITNIVQFGDKDAGDIMTHRKNIVAVDGAWTLKQTVEFILNERNSRFPVYNKDIDNIIGVLHLKDVLKAYSEEDKREWRCV